MRLVLLLLLFGALAVTNSETVDSLTAEWIYRAVCSNDTSATNSVGADSEARPPCQPPEKAEQTDPEVTHETRSFNLNPTGTDLTVDCTTKTGERGTCVLYYQCNPETHTVIEDGASLIDLRENICPHYLEVCCKENDVESNGESSSRYNPDAENMPIATTNKPVSSPPATDQPVPTFAPIPATTIASTAAPSKAKSKKVKSKYSGCGWSNPGANIRLRSGDAGEPDSPFANYGDFPWMVALLRKTDDSGIWSDGDYLGGGTMIHPSVVVTVAHKLSIRKKKLQPADLKCRAGEWDTQTTREMFEHQERDVDRFVIHEEYDRTSVLNDIALLIVKEPFQLAMAPHMGTGCLAASPPAVGADCYSMGWGRDFRKKDKTLPSVLKKVKLKYVEPDSCQSLLRRTRLGDLFFLHESLTCANGEEGVDTCRGDGGSSLVCPISGTKGVQRYAVYGMVAYGITCGDPLVPGVYANVPRLKSWVDQKMQELGFGTEEYTIS